MPRFPDVSPVIGSMANSVYSALAHRLAQHPGPTFPLHVGDTWMEPAQGCRMEDFSVSRHPGMHRYTNPHGLPALVDALVKRTQQVEGLPTTADQVLITAGATGGLGAAMGALVQPGDEVLVSAPFWPLIAGMVRCFGGNPVAVPLVGEAHDASSAVSVFAARRTARTCAVYLNTPNNPTGRVLPLDWLKAITAWARSEGLWIVSDEVYEHYVYEGSHHYCRPLAPERTIAAYSFSKAFGMAGNRCGYLVGPAQLIAEVQKVSTHTFYSAPTASQLAALAALGPAGSAWVRRARARYAELGAACAKRLGVPSPEGSTFLFLDVSDALDERGLVGLLEDCVGRGLLVAPGPSFGPYPTHIRVCFTSVEPERVLAGVEILAELLGR